MYMVYRYAFDERGILKKYSASTEIHVLKKQ